MFTSSEDEAYVKEDNAWAREAAALSVVADVGVMSEHAKARVPPSYACAKDEPRHSLSGERAGSKQGSSERVSDFKYKCEGK